MIDPANARRKPGPWAREVVNPIPDHDKRLSGEKAFELIKSALTGISDPRDRGHDAAGFYFENSLYLRGEPMVELELQITVPGSLVQKLREALLRRD